MSAPEIAAMASLAVLALCAIGWVINSAVEVEREHGVKWLNKGEQDL